MPPKNGKGKNAENKMIVYWGYIGIMEKMEATKVCCGDIRLMEKEMEATIVYLGYVGITENKMETTIY